MKWLLLLVIAWADPLPPIVEKIPVEDEQICRLAADRVRTDFRRPTGSPGHDAPRGASPVVPEDWRMPQVTAICLQISN